MTCLNFFFQTKRVLVPYPARKPEGVDTINNLSAVLKQKNIEIIPLAIDEISDLIPRLKTYLPRVDVLLLIREAVYFDAGDLFVNLSRRYHVPIYASDSHSVYQGATAGFGVSESVAGVVAAEQTRNILIDGKSILNTPPIDLNSRSSLVLLNRQAIIENNCIDQRLLFLAGSSATISNTGNLEMIYTLGSVA